MPHLWHGVTLFFVLSGFLLYRPFAAAAMRRTQAPSIARYARNRGLRILPAYWVVLLLTSYLLQAALVPGPGGARTEGALPADLLLLNAFFLQNYSEATMFTGIGPAWSVVVELVFYAALPLLAVLALRLSARGRDGRTAVLIPVALLVVIGASGKLAALVAFDWTFGVARSFWGLADMFALGMLVAVASVSAEDGRLRLPRRWRAGTIAVALAAIALALSLGTSNLEEHDARNFAYNVCAAVASALLLALVVVSDGRRGDLLHRVLESRLLVGAGLISYSVFLWHEPLLRWLRVQGLSFDGSAGFLVNVALVAALTVVLSFLTYRFVEVPALRLKGRPARGPAAPRGETHREPALRDEEAAATVPREQFQAAP